MFSGTISSRPLSARTPTTYYDPQGKAQQGYIFNKQTFTDPEGKQRIPVGSTVNTAGGSYYMTPGGGILTGRDALNQYLTGAQSGTAAYQDAQAAQQRAIKASVDAALARIGQSAAEAKRGTVDANRQAYQNYITASNPYGAGAQQRTALGLSNSGLAESSQVALGSAYQTAMSDNAQNEQRILAELAVARQEAQLSGDVASADAAAEYANLITQHGLQTANTLLNAQTNLYQTALGEQTAREARADSIEQRDWEREQYERKLTDAAETETWERAFQMFGSGIATEDIARILGVPLGILQERLNAATASRAYSGGGGGGGGGGSYDVGTYAPEYVPDASSAPTAGDRQAQAVVNNLRSKTGSLPGFELLQDPWSLLPRAQTIPPTVPQELAQTNGSVGVTNQHGDSWVNVAGFGRLSWAELLQMVESGQIVEVIAGNSITYKKR